jgi:pteridine reductase
MSIAIHYRESAGDAERLCDALNRERSDSATLHQCDLRQVSQLAVLVADVAREHGGLHALINNASSFYATAVEAVTEGQWNDLMSTNVKAPFFLAQAAHPWLRASHGCIVNMVDIYGYRPLSGYPVYSTAKAALIMQTQALAQAFAPEVRVNALAPGPILQHGDASADAPPMALPEAPLNRWGEEHEIADAALFLVRDATFTTGTVLPVDGGRLRSGF